MYQYDEQDHKLLRERVAQFRSQTERYLAGELTDEEFLPLRLQNGLYIQRLAPMFRIAVPYGMLNSRQLRRLAHVTRKYDKGYAHFTTRQNVQLHWPHLEDVPDILSELADVEMHSIQTSGNCIRNTTSDQFAGIARDELLDPRPYCELIRQWSTFHPEFAFLPRKFKIAVCAAEEDRVAIRAHDIGVQIVKNARGETGFQIFVGGGLGRTPVIGVAIRDFLPETHLLSYLQAIVRIYNQLGRRDNKFKARIKILVKALGAEEFGRLVEAEWEQIRDGAEELTPEAIAWAKRFFPEQPYKTFSEGHGEALLRDQAGTDKAFARWLERNTFPHRVPGYQAVTLSTKPSGIPPGDVTDRQLEAIADLADEYSFGEVRVTHEQNVVLADVEQEKLYEMWQLARKHGFATPNIGTLTDMICCPGGDYCSLANAKSIPVAEAIQREFEDLDYLYDLGDLDVNISGCMNACGHHHIGHIGILGVDKKGEEFYQVTLGGSSNQNAALGKVLGPSFSRAEIPHTVVKIIDVFVENRQPEELFIDTYNRIGLEPFKERVYAKAS